jgi:hypothetical protein
MKKIAALSRGFSEFFAVGAESTMREEYCFQVTALPKCSSSINLTLILIIKELNART